MAYIQQPTTTVGRAATTGDDPNNPPQAPPPPTTPPPPEVPPTATPPPAPPPSPTTPPFDTSQIIQDALNRARQTGAQPGANATADQLRSYVTGYAKVHPGSNPSLTRDPDYWVRRMQETHPNGDFDYGYWESRFNQPEGPPEGANRPPAGPYGPDGRGIPVGPGGPQHQLSQRVDPNRSFTGQDALAYLNQQSQTLRGKPLSQDEIQQARQLIGYQEGQQVSGVQMNQLLGELDKLVPQQGPTADGPGGPGPNGGPGPGGPNPTAGYGDQLLRMLMGRANQGLNIDPNDPIISGQVNAFRATQDRGIRNALSTAAERGGPNSNTAAVGRSLTERGNQNVTGLQSQLMQTELTSRRNEIQQSLTEMGSLLTERQRLQLQEQLGILDAALRQQQIGNQNSQFYSGLDQNQNQFLRNLMLQYGYLNSQNDQFAANYNLNSTDRANYWDSLRRGLL